MMLHQTLKLDGYTSPNTPFLLDAFGISVPFGQGYNVDVGTCKMRILMQVNICILPTEAPRFTSAT